MLAMHEMSIMLSVWNSIEEEFALQKYSKLHNVELEIGEFLGVVDESLEVCWESIIMEKPFARGASLKIVKIQSLVKCDLCGNTWDFQASLYLCPICGVAHSTIITGKGIEIVGMDVD